ncbi:MAG TPA: heavy metal-responsive transcriptional regulator [Thermoanaerobaculia bacterium]|nr:heavy metal-responsive transcriptional regulator [Thermoanaerobaculia bacterium]
MPTRHATLRIGEVACRAGVSVETVRYYERVGLLEPAPRDTSSGYRMFSEQALRRLRFIRRTQDLGFSLEEIRDLLSLRATPDATALDVRERVQQKLGDVRRNISDLEQIAASLERLTASCDGRGSVRECVILDTLDLEGTAAPPA